MANDPQVSYKATGAEGSWRIDIEQRGKFTEYSIFLDGERVTRFCFSAGSITNLEEALHKARIALRQERERHEGRTPRGHV